MDSVKVVKSLSNHLFSKRATVQSLWQDIAEQFHPERADFTSTRNLGSEMCSGLMTSYPVIACRDLGNSLGYMLRKDRWFKAGTNRPEDDLDLESLQWLDWVTKFQYNVMYDRRAYFTKAAKMADMDFAAFGQAAISVELNGTLDGLLFRNWHLRDMSWQQDASGKVCTIFRKWAATANDLVDTFGRTKVHPKVLEYLRDDPYHIVQTIHAVMPSETYAKLTDSAPMRQPYVSLFLDCSHDHEIERNGSWTPIYVIPRWSLSSGSQYANSPAVVAALPDSRLLQAMTRVLLEAGEKATNPPMLGVSEAIRSDVSIFAGGITWVDADFDGHLDQVLRPLTIDKSGLNFGAEQLKDTRMQLAEALYLSKLNLPPVDAGRMTATEINARMEQWVREVLPIFAPVSEEYNGELCDQVFTLILHNAPEIYRTIPRQLAGQEIVFQFKNPITDTADKLKGTQLVEGIQIIAAGMQTDPSVAAVMDSRKAVRDALEATVPPDWLRSEADVDKMLADQAAQQQQQAQMDQMAQGAAAVKDLGGIQNMPGAL